MIERTLPPFTNVAASGTAHLSSVPLGEFAIYGFQFDLSGTDFTAALSTGIRLVLDGKRIWDITGAHLNKINQYYGFEAIDDEGFAYIWLGDPNARTAFGEMLGALDVSGGRYRSLSIEWDIGAADAPTLTGKVFLAQPKPANNAEKGVWGKEMFRSMVKKTTAVTGAAQHTLEVPLGTSQGALIRAIHFMDAGDLLTALSVKRDGGFLLEDAAELALDETQLNFNRAPQALHHAFDPMLSNNFSDAVPTLQKGGKQRSVFDIRATTSNTDTITTYSDLLVSYEQAA